MLSAHEQLDAQAGPSAAETARDAAPAARLFTRACLIGGALGALVFAWMLTRGTFDFLQWQRVGSFYDAQAHSFLGGHLSVNGDILGIEAYHLRGNSYMYEGPAPALLRIPILIFAGHHLDGRLTQLSMLVAFLVALVFACRLHWRVRLLVRGDAPVGRVEAFTVGLFTFVLAGGSALLYEASRAWVYDEALTWGAAFALASIFYLLVYVQRPSWRALALSSLFAACALLTRASIGIGPVVGLGLVWVGLLARDLRGRLSARRRDPLRALRWLAPADDHPDGARHSLGWAALGAATVVPVGLYAVVNYAKFRTLFSVPFYTQAFSQTDPGRQAFLAKNHGTLFGLQFTPTTLLQYFRPDALRFTRLFPFVDFPPFPGHIFGNVQFDVFDRTSSLPSSLTFLFVLAVAGLIVLFRPAAWRAPAPLASLRVPVLAAIAGTCAIFPFGYVANRYVGDFLPILAIAGAIGLQTLLRRHRTAPVTWVRVAVVALVPLALFTTWVNFALAIRYQRELSYNLKPAVIAGFVGFQHDVSSTLGGRPISVGQGSALPDGVGHPGELFALDHCEGLYVSDGLPTNIIKRTPWNAVEETNEAGHFILRVRFPSRPVGTRVPIFTNGPASAPNIFFAEYRPGSSILFEFQTKRRGESRRYLAFPIDVGREYTLDVSADAHVDLLTVQLGDVDVFDTFYRYPGHDFHLGRNDTVRGVAARFPGSLRQEPATAPLCQTLVRAVG